MQTTTTAPAPPHPPQGLIRRHWRSLIIALSASLALLPAQAQPIGALNTSVQVTLPNGFLDLHSNDLTVSSPAGMVNWSRWWDGAEWKFNPQWESLSQSWKNMTGSQTADTTASTIGARQVPSLTISTDYGCWVWVDDGWEPTKGTVLAGGALDMGAMPPERTTPFNRTMGNTGADYPAPRYVSIDYASLCAGSRSDTVQSMDTEGIRKSSELYIGEKGIYLFDARFALVKRAVRQAPATAATTLYANLATGHVDMAPERNAKGYRWIDRGRNWMDYNTQGQVVAFGDRNDNTIWLLRDSQGRVLGAIDDNGHVLLSLHYSGQRLTEVRDHPVAGRAGDLATRSIQYDYDEKNRLTQVTDTRGNTIRYSYDISNRITQVTDQEGRTERILYEGELVKQRITADGATTDYEFSYDDVHKQFISKITGPQTAAGRRVREYTHNRVGKLVRRVVNGRTEVEMRYDTGAWSETRTNARGFSTKTSKNEFEQIIRIEHPDGGVERTAYSSSHMGITEQTDALGVKTKYEYDARGNLLKKIEAAGTAEERITQYQVNARGQVIRVTRKGRTEVNGSITPDAVWQIAYDAIGNISQTIDPEGHTRAYVYNRLGQLVRYTDPLGNATNYEVDTTGKPTKITNLLGHLRTFSYDRTGNLTSSTDARGKTTLMAYDAMNQPIQTTNTVGGQHKRRYDMGGLMIGETDEDGRVTNAEYDLFQRLSRTSDALANVTSYSDLINDGSATGGLGSVLEPTEIRYPGLTQQIRYDARERPTSETLINISGSQSVTSTTSKTYDALGQLKSETDANGKTRSYVYDALGQIIEAVDVLGGKTQARYDARGNLIEVIDAKGSTTRFAYSTNDRLTSKTLAEGQVTRYSYDAAGNLTERTAPAGNKKRYSYDAAKRVTQIQQTRAETVIRTVALTWDAENNLTAWSDTDPTRPEGQQTTSATLTYDDAGRKTSETVNYPNPAGSSYRLAYAYEYSKAGKKTKLTWADGTAIGYSYSAHGELELVSIPGEGNISVNRYKWLAPARLTLPGGGIQEKTWDGLFNLEALSSTTPGQQTTLHLANSYGKRNEIKTERRTDSIDGASSTRASSYDYDDELRLTRVVTDTGGLFGRDTETFGLDLLANRITHSRTGSGAWQYDQNHRLLQHPGMNGGTVSYTYDANGNRTQKTEGTDTTRYQYDSDNRLIEVQNGAGNTIARYGYDPMNRRIWKEQYRDRAGQPITPAVRTYFLYTDEGPIAEATQTITINADQSISASAAPTITTQYGPRPDSEFMTGVLFIKTKNGNGRDVVAYYHGNHLEVPLQATDSAGNVVWAANYNAFGRADVVTPRSATGDSRINSQLRLPGQYEDVETGLHYNFHRYYDLDIGRYSQIDPIGLRGGLNGYVYVNGNPLSFTDPLGLDVELRCRPAEIVAGLVNHCWLKTDTIEAGMNEKVTCSRAGNNWKKDYFPNVVVSDHQCDIPTVITPVPFVDEDCVNRELQIGKPLGMFLPPFKSCQTFAQDVIQKCAPSSISQPYIKYPIGRWRPRR
ncbi:RHS repeat protein [Verminephrobacter eiseniae]|uniref:RHS repeat-associated core domain-containing protein n=1 Tax=Verminephrobacter eiseniae TaxID=364317 RepID=UPI0022380389|nr:RHS repeat-associated core domain-containing protein [Verminephrobacter eiseniae]MCW5261122.1 RHS repeat protein [Verminephrobacter eiseniae]